MVGDTPPHDSDDERDDLAALDFSVAESEQAESDLDALGDYAEEPAEDDELPVPVFTVTNPPGTVTVTAFLDGRVKQIDLSPKVTDMTETDLADEIVRHRGSGHSGRQVGPVRLHARRHAAAGP